MRSLLLVVTALVLTSCAGGGASDVVIEEIDGVTYVRNGARIDTTGFPYRFVLEQTFGTNNWPDEEILGRVLYFDVNDDGGLYVADVQSNRLVAFASDGSVVWADGEAGEGPGEFTYMRGVVELNDTLLAVGNRSGTYVDFWKTDGTFLESRMTPKAGGIVPTLAAVSPSGGLIMADFEMGVIGQGLRYIDFDDWMITDSLQIMQTVEKEVPLGFIISQRTTYSDRYIVAGSMTSDYAFWMYDYDHGLERVVSREVDFLPGFGSGKIGRGSTIITGSTITVMQPLENGDLLSYVSWRDMPDPDIYAQQSMEGKAPSAESFETVDIFDSKGRYVASQTWGAATGSLGEFKLVKNGYLYTKLDQPFPQIRRYRIEPK